MYYGTRNCFDRPCTHEAFHEITGSGFHMLKVIFLGVFIIPLSYTEITLCTQIFPV
jgi:hypothetical protein